MPKFKHAATFLTKDGAQTYKEFYEKLGYEVRVLTNKYRNGTAEYVVYQSREKVR